MKLVHSLQILVRGAFVLACLIAAGSNVRAAPADDVRQADAALATGDVFVAMSLLRRAADQNDALAQARLGDLLHAAEFDAEALVLYRKSAEQGEAAGEFGLGRMYADGAGVPRDPAKALEWYRKAESKNHPQTLDALARAYRTGSLGLARDLDRANALDERVRTLYAAQKAAAK